MREKQEKVKIMLKRILSLSFLVMIIFSGFFLSACIDGIDDDPNNPFGSELNYTEYLSGFKGATRFTSPGQEAIDEKLFQNLSEGIIGNLVALYGSGRDFNDKYGIMQQWNNGNYDIDQKILPITVYPDLETPIDTRYTDERYISENSFIYDSIRHNLIVFKLIDSNGLTVAQIKNNYPNSKFVRLLSNQIIRIDDANPSSVTISYSEDVLLNSLTTSSELSNYYIFYETGKSWDWNFSLEKSFLALNIPGLYEDFIEDAKTYSEKDYSTYYKNLYSKALEINILEIVLADEQLTQFKPLSAGTLTNLQMQIAGQPARVINALASSPVNELDDSAGYLSDRLDYLRKKYIREASSIGVDWDEPNWNNTNILNGSYSWQNPNSVGGKIVTHILENVIGIDKFFNVNVNGTIYPYYDYERSYREKVGYFIKDMLERLEVTESNVSEVNAMARRPGNGKSAYVAGDFAGNYFAYPGIQYGDYRLNDLFVSSSNSVGDFDLVPPSEYQSIVLKPKQRIKFDGAVLMFQAKNRTNTENPLKIRVGLRYYDAVKGGDPVVKYCGTVNVCGEYKLEYPTPKGFDYDMSVELGPNSPIWIDPFVDHLPENNVWLKDYGKLSREKSSAYKAMPSQNGFGSIAVLNEKVFNFSFVEFFFDVVKTSKDEGVDYSFQVCMSILLLNS